MKLCLTLILVLAGITPAVNKGVIISETAKYVCYEYTVIEKNTFPLYDSGSVVDYVQLKQIGKARVVDKYYEIVQALIDSACADGVTITVNSGYRSFEDQINIRRRYLKDKCKRDSIDYLIEAESTNFSPETARPGHSRHHSGIAYDFNTRVPEVYEWLKKNAHKFRFFRTVHTERWHWEYHPNICDKYHFIEEDHWSWKNRIKLTKKRYGKI